MLILYKGESHTSNVVLHGQTAFSVQGIIACSINTHTPIGNARAVAVGDDMPIDQNILMKQKKAKVALDLKNFKIPLFS